MAGENSSVIKRIPKNNIKIHRKEGSKMVANVGILSIYHENHAHQKSKSKYMIFLDILEMVPCKNFRHSQFSIQNENK